MSVIMNHFGLDELPDELYGSKIHRLENVMTVVPDFQTYFNQLKVWFVPTVRPNQL